MPTYTSYSGELASWTDRYVSLGRKEALENRPPSNAVMPDTHEATLEAEASKWMGSEQHLFDVVITDSSKAASEVQQKLVELNARVERMLNDNNLQGHIAADLQAERSALVDATVSRLTAERDLKFFREENEIREVAVYPDSRVMHVAIVAALALVETVMNAFFYENAQGLVGGFMVALAISVVLMGSSFLLGYFFRKKNLKAVNEKGVGWGCLLVFIVMAIWTNAVFAAFRGEYQLLADPTDGLALRDAFKIASGEAKNIFVFDMQFSDLMSLILFGLGFLLSCLAFYKGYTLDDKYPGHGLKDRSLKFAKKLEASQRDLLLQKVKELLQRSRAEMDAAAHEPSQLIGRAASKVGELQHSQKSIGIQSKAVQSDYERVLRAYRGANVAVRAVEKPAYFDIYPDLTRQVRLDAAESSIQAFVDIQEQVKAQRDRHKDSLNAKLQLLVEQAARILSETFGEFLRAVEREAQANIDRTAQPVHAAYDRAIHDK